MFPDVAIKEEPKDNEYTINDFNNFKEEIAPEMDALNDNHEGKTPDEKIRIKQFRQILNFPGRIVKPTQVWNIHFHNLKLFYEPSFSFTENH